VGVEGEQLPEGGQTTAFAGSSPGTGASVGTTDENYSTLRAFFDHVGDHLTVEGRVLLSFGTTGDVDYLEQRISGAHLRSEVIAHRDLVRSGQTVGYFTYRLTGPS